MEILIVMASRSMMVRRNNPLISHSFYFVFILMGKINNREGEKERERGGRF
jgi:hypothetical protein